MKVKYALMVLLDVLVVAASVTAAALRIQPTPDIVWALVVYLFAVDAVKNIEESRKPTG